MAKSQWQRLTKDTDILRGRGLMIELILTATPALRRRSLQFQGTLEHKKHLATMLEQWLEAGLCEPAISDDHLHLFPVPKPGIYIYIS